MHEFRRQLSDMSCIQTISRYLPAFYLFDCFLICRKISVRYINPAVVFLRGSDKKKEEKSWLKFL